MASPDGSERRLGLALVLSTAVISGISIYVNRFAVVGIPPALFTGLKNAFVASLFVALLLATGEARTLPRLPRRDWARLLGIGLVGGSIPFVLFFQGLVLLGDAPTASFVHKTMFLYVALFAFVFLKERADAYLYAASGLLLLGLFVAIAPAFAGDTYGLALIFLATLFWGAEVTLSKSVLRRVGANTVVAARMGFGSAFIATYLLLTGQFAALGALDGTAWGWIIVTVAFLAGYVGTFYHGLQRIDATSATSLLLVGAVVTLGLEAALDGAAVSLVQAAGIALVVLGALAAALRALRYREVEHPDVPPVPS